MDDLISRQEAIKELERKKDKDAKGDIGGFYNKIIQNDIDTLTQLPSAQPETIRCKDCVYYEKDYIDKLSGWCNVWSNTTRYDGYCHEAEPYKKENR